jgi:hypothetical protein
VQQLKLLRYQHSDEITHTCDVPSWVVEARHKSSLDWIERSAENNGNRRGRRLLLQMLKECQLRQ